MLWWVGSGMLVLWACLKFGLHKKGLVHLLLLTAISLLVVEFVAYRKTKYQKQISGK